jgi:hypothetical protein
MGSKAYAQGRVSESPIRIPPPTSKSYREAERRATEPTAVSLKSALPAFAQPPVKIQELRDLSPSATPSNRGAQAAGPRKTQPVSQAIAIIELTTIRK